MLFLVHDDMSESAPAEGGPKTPSPVTINDKTYAPLADGTYDAIFLGTGLKECILAGLLSVSGKKVCPPSYLMETLWMENRRNLSLRLIR